MENETQAGPERERKREVHCGKFTGILIWSHTNPKPVSVSLVIFCSYEILINTVKTVVSDCSAEAVSQEDEEMNGCVWRLLEMKKKRKRIALQRVTWHTFGGERAGRSMNEQQGVLANTLKLSPTVKSSWRAPLWCSAHPSARFCSQVELFCPRRASLRAICPVRYGCQDGRSKREKRGVGM